MNKIVVAIVVSGGQVLMVRRRAKEGSLQWQFPSGGVEENETEMQAAEREVFEETGVSCRAAQSLGHRVHPNTSREVHYVQCNYITGEARVADKEELDLVQWMRPKDVYAAVTSDIFTEVRTLLDRLQDSGT